MAASASPDAQLTDAATDMQTARHSNRTTATAASIGVISGAPVGRGRGAAPPNVRQKNSERLKSY